MIRTIADPWLAQNAGRRYPLRDDSPLRISDNVLLDFRCTVVGSAAGDDVVATLGSVAETADGRTVAVYVTVTGTQVAALVFTVPSGFAGTSFTAVAEDGRSFGELTVSAALFSAETKYYGAEFAKTTVVVDGLKVDSIQAVPGVAYDDIEHPDTRISGDVFLDDGANAEPYLDGQALRVDVAKGNGRGEWCQVPEARQTCANVLFTVNGERPGSDGELGLVGEDGVRVIPRPEEHAVEISIDGPAADVMSETCEPQCGTGG